MIRIIKRLKKFRWCKQLILMPIYYLSQDVVPKICIFVNSTSDLTAEDISYRLYEEFKDDYGVSYNLYDNHYADFFIHLDGSKGIQDKGFTF